MANMLMASSTKTPTTPTTTTTTPKPKLPSYPSRTPLVNLPPLKTPKLSFSLLKSAALSATPLSLSYLLPHPSFAEEIEKASLFDFNLTLPIIMAEFLILMFALDKIYFTPLGDFMDQRDSKIKEELSGVKDTSQEVKQLEEQANAVMRAARAEISAALNKMKKETQVEVEAKLAEGRKKIEGELQEALASLEKQKEETIKSLDSQISELSDDIVKKVLPVSASSSN